MAYRPMTGVSTENARVAAMMTEGSCRAMRNTQAPYRSGAYILSADVASGPKSPRKADSIMP